MLWRRWVPRRFDLWAADVLFDGWLPNRAERVSLARELPGGVAILPDYVLLVRVRDAAQRRRGVLSADLPMWLPRSRGACRAWLRVARLERAARAGQAPVVWARDRQVRRL